MKQSTIILFLFLLILNPSPAQRDWRLFDQFGFVHQIYQSADDSLWVIGVDDTWQLDDQGWQKIDQVSAFVFEDSTGPSGLLDPTVKVFGAITPTVGTKKRRSLVLLIQSIRNPMALSGWAG